MRKATLFSMCGALICASVLFSELILLARNYHAGKSRLHMTVFIHGSLFTQLWPLDVKSVLSGILPGSSPYVEIIKRARKNPLLWQDQALLQEGWCQVPSRTVENFCNDCFATDDQEKAAYLIVPSYHMIATYQDAQEDNVYFLFGHLGLLSHQYRNQVAQEELYAHLCDTIAAYARDYWNITLTIVAHSHGGNIALNLVEAEHKHRRGLVVDNLVMWGTPIQFETLGYVYTPLFKRVVNCYSDGDWVQGIDTVSTKQRTCFKKLYDERLDFCRPVRANTQVCDVRWLVDGNAQRVGHGNMWLLGREEKALAVLDPLPAMILTPVLLTLLDQVQHIEKFDCDIVHAGNQLRLNLCKHDTDQLLVSSEDVYPIARKAQELTCKHWKSVDKSRMVLLNYQTGASLWQAFQEWRAGGYQTEENSVSS